MLKKEFKRKDVDRARNLLMGKSGASSETQVGYKKKRVDYKEGDVWVENKKTWTIKDGIKQTISKMDAIKKEIFMPLCCPKCGKVMKSQLDKPVYKIHKTCHNCLIDYEAKLKLRGEYDDYIKELRLTNAITQIDEFEGYFLELANQSNEGYVSEHGEIERWKGGIDINKITSEISKKANEAREEIRKELTNKKD